MNGLSFLVSDPEKNAVLFFKEMLLEHSTTPEELLIEAESIIAENPILQEPFSEVSVIYATQLYTLVPLPLFDESKASEYLKFNSKILANDYMAHDILNEHDLVVVYVPLMNINNYFFDKFGAFNYYHSSTILLKTILQREKFSLTPKIYLHFQKNSFDCIVLKNGKLELCNSYPFITPDDFIYYTLFCMEQLKLNPETVQLELLGDIEEKDEYYKMAYTYIRNIKFFEFEPLFTTAAETIPQRSFILNLIP
ncbi:MAG TPA: DUF3822 family protein [Aequorivita sp.]|nr:DUF3822 family protein [Aequorivita sp.]